VLTNLFLNALTHAFPEGRDGTINIRAQEVDNRYIEISIADDGTGMTPEIQRRIFEPFFTTKPHGTGLGLAMAYAFVQRHRGRIEVESELGKGSTFRLRLPLREDESEA
jgi:signal transduction histidine kinase